MLFLAKSFLPASALSLSLAVLAIAETSPATRVSRAHPSEDGAPCDSADRALAVLKDGELSGPRTRLLDLAFQAASALPRVPHLKNRSRAQAAVVGQYLELGQPQRALRCIAQIDDWRRGLAYADLAFYCARNGDAPGALGCAERAHEMVEAPDEGVEQGWRKDRIQVRLAQTHALLGDMERAVELEADVVPSEMGKVEAVRASISAQDEFDAHMRYVEAVAVSSEFDQLRSAITTCAELFSRFYENEQRRSASLTRIRELEAKLPRMIRIEVSIDLARRALARGDRDGALELVNDGQAILDSVEWTLEDGVALSARLARVRFECGDGPRAHEQARATLKRYRGGSEDIVDMFRARALRPLAEAFCSMGEQETAAVVYGMALDEGARNPNSRPRAEDLSATCLSMASIGFEPDDALWERLAELRANLVAPW